MDHIVIKVNPWLMAQQIAVYKNGNCIETQECTLQSIPDAISALSKEYDIINVDLAGPKQFTTKVKERLSVSKYENLIVTIY